MNSMRKNATSRVLLTSPIPKSGGRHTENEKKIKGKTEKGMSEGGGGAR